MNITLKETIEAYDKQLIRTRAAIQNAQRAKSILVSKRVALINKAREHSLRPS